MENRRRRFSPARKVASGAARAWPVWLAAATGLAVFTCLQHPVAARHRLLERAASLSAERVWVERAVAAAAQNHPPGTLVSPESWRPLLDPQAPRALREHGLDALGNPYGPQPADRPLTLSPQTRRTLDSIPAHVPASKGP